MSNGCRTPEARRKTVSNMKGSTQPIISESSLSHLISCKPSCRAWFMISTTSVANVIALTSPQLEEVRDILPDSSSWCWQKYLLSSSMMTVSIASTMWGGMWSRTVGLKKSHMVVVDAGCYNLVEWEWAEWMTGGLFILVTLSVVMQDPAVTCIVKHMHNKTF